MATPRAGCSESNDSFAWGPWVVGKRVSLFAARMRSVLAPDLPGDILHHQSNEPGLSSITPHEISIRPPNDVLKIKAVACGEKSPELALLIWSQVWGLVRCRSANVEHRSRCPLSPRADGILMDNLPESRLPRSKVAQYVRMSTEHQQYSPENQSDVIRLYAESHNMEIVQTYADHGRSGLEYLRSRRSKQTRDGGGKRRSPFFISL